MLQSKYINLGIYSIKYRRIVTPLINYLITGQFTANDFNRDYESIKTGAEIKCICCDPTTCNTTSIIII